MEINIRSVYKIDARAEIMTILAFWLTLSRGRTLETEWARSSELIFMRPKRRFFVVFKGKREPPLECWIPDNMTCWFNFTTKSLAWKNCVNVVA